MDTRTPPPGSGRPPGAGRGPRRAGRAPAAHWGEWAPVIVIGLAVVAFLAYFLARVAG
ncbi:hypothetical protein ACFYYR_20705 [Streptomyces sp. NPDC001922]|uniref:hypothetical protein n=1 Tax=Streptomyces sp. NPDC001922 TaxID=3364624 RepID=UPI0036A274BD